MDAVRRMPALCPICGEIVDVVEPALGREAECADCGTRTTVTSEDPLELAAVADLENEPAQVPPDEDAGQGGAR